MSDPMLIRIRCMNTLCRKEFDRPDSITEDEGTFLREKSCPHCECDATTLADVQPRPPVWWSDSRGLLTRVSRRSVGDKIRYKILSDELNNRLLVSLPEDAEPLAPQARALEDSVRRQRAADRVSAFLDAFGKIDDGSNRSDVYRLNVADRLTVADLRLLVQAAPALPPKWSHLLADPEVYIVQDTGDDRVDAVVRVRALIKWAREEAPEVDEVFRHDAVVLTVSDLETLCDLDGGIAFVTFTRERAEALADGKRTALAWTAVQR